LKKYLNFIWNIVSLLKLDKQVYMNLYKI